MPINFIEPPILLKSIKYTNSMRTIVFAVSLLAAVSARKGFGPTDQEWGYVDVRPGAHLFWWLHKATTANNEPYKRPLIIWIQGGPGIPASGYGNFAELGPLDVDLKPRNSSWVQWCNVLFVDSPVGTGFSYVDSNDTYATSNTQVAEDFVVFLLKFYETIPELKKVPLYMFGQSYGGKMGVEIALLVDKAVKSGTIEVDFRGVGFGGAWISPIDFVMTWGTYLLNIGAVDQSGYEAIQEVAEQTQAAVENGTLSQASDLWASTQFAIMKQTNFIDFYNVLMKIKIPSLGFGQQEPDDLGIRETIEHKIEVLMSRNVQEALGLNETWKTEPQEVFEALQAEFMEPVTDIVELLLNTTDLRVAIYNGQLDLIVDTPGAMRWVDRLKFSNCSEWKTAQRDPIIVDGVIEGYVKRLGNLAFYWVNRAGHWIPCDNPAAMRYILDDVINGFK